eukprot:jgi/Chlat1/5385/Chrsp35S05299
MNSNIEHLAFDRRPNIAYDVVNESDDDIHPKDKEVHVLGSGALPLLKTLTRASAFPVAIDHDNTRLKNLCLGCTRGITSLPMSKSSIQNVGFVHDDEIPPPSNDGVFISPGAVHCISEDRVASTCVDSSHEVHRRKTWLSKIEVQF